MKMILEAILLLGILAGAITLNWIFLAVAGAAGMFLGFFPEDEPKRSRTSYLRGWRW